MLYRLSYLGFWNGATIQSSRPYFLAGYNIARLFYRVNTLFNPMSVLNPVPLVLIVENPANHLTNADVLVYIPFEGHSC